MPDFKPDFECFNSYIILDHLYPLQHLSTTFIPGVFKVSRAGR
jgi:hypothetical protein